MSEEEIIKDLTKYISFANKSENFANDNDFKWNTELSQRVQTLLDLYNKEKEKNEKLKIELMEQELFIDGLKEDRRIAAEEIQEEYYVSKDKIKEKMQQDIYTNEHTILGGRRNGKTLEYGIRLGRIQMCEELLEERN